MNSKIVTFIVSAVVVGAIAGFIVGQNYKGKPVLPASLQPQSTSPQIKFTTQNATLNGKTMSVNDKEITVLSLDGESITLPIGEKARVTRLSVNPATATVSEDFQSVEINKDVVVNLTFDNGEFKVSSVTVLPMNTGFVSTSSGQAR